MDKEKGMGKGRKGKGKGKRRERWEGKGGKEGRSPPQSFLKVSTYGTRRTVL